MDIKTLAATLQTNFIPTPGTLQLPATGAQQQLQSADIAGLLTNYLSGTLTITGLQPPQVGANTVTYSGQVSFLGMPLAATAIFYLVNSASDGTPELTLALALPAGWTFGQTYAPLKNQIVDELSFDQPNFVLESFTQDNSGTFANLKQGLNFSGTAQPSSAPLKSVGWLLGDSLLLTGGLTNWNDPQKTAPTMTLASASQATSLTLGTVALSTALTVTSSYSTPKSGDPVLQDSVAISGTVSIGSGNLLTLTMELESDPDLLTFKLDANAALQSLADLTGLAGGTALGNLIPPQYPLSSLLRLDDFTIVVAPALQQIVNMSFGIVLLQNSSSAPINQPRALLNAAPAEELASVHVSPSFTPLLGPPLRRQLAELEDESDLAMRAEPASTALALPANAALVSEDAGPTSPTWVIIPGALSINNIFLNILIVDPLHFSRNNLFIKFGAIFWIAELYPIEVAIALPDVELQLFLLPGNTIPLTDLLQHFGVTPPEGFELTITEFQMVANPSYKTFDLTASIDADVTLLSLNDGKFNLTLTGLQFALSLSQTGFAGQFIAYSNFAQVVDFFISAQKPDAASSAWVFAAQITHPFSVGDLIENVTGWNPPDFIHSMQVTEFGISYNTGTKDFALDVGFEWDFKEIGLTIDLIFKLQSSQNAQKQTLYAGSIEGDFEFMGLKLTFIYAFDQVNKTNTYTLKFGPAIVTFANPDKSGDKVIQVNFGNTTFGDILVYLIKLADPAASPKLTAPWDVLNAINLQNLSLTVNFTKNFIEVDYKGVFDLGFIKLENVGLKYTRNYGQGKVQVNLAGEFLGQSFGKDNPLTWDAVNGQPPVVPGAGAKLLDLEYVGVGQHVSLDTTALTTVTQVITALEKTVVPLTNVSKNPLEQVGGLHFDSASNWMLGAKFKLLDTFAINLVFLDPQVYGLLIQISGPSASIFEGLSFEIIYRKVSDNLGVFHIELKLPDIMRHLEFGEVSVTLPIIVIDIYTNGNFRIDFGFPKSLQDFSNSFALEVFPFVGYGGFYFAVLNGETSTRVPRIDNGNFNPVIEFGFALSVGVGKTLTLGPLSAGVSVTVIGMLQGVLAWFHPNDDATPKAMYYWIQGTVAVIGKVYGTVDFVVIKASVSLTVYASITLTVEAHQPIQIFMQAGVEVKVSLKILFITLHFSFSATISLKFTIGSASLPPWHVTSPAPRQLEMRSGQSLARAPQRLAAFDQPRLLSARPQVFSFAARAATGEANDITKLTLWLTPLISQALPSDFPVPPDAATLLTTCNLLLLIENAVPSEAKTAAQVNQPVKDAAAQPFNMLLGKLLQWAIQFIGKDTGDTLTAEELQAIHEQLNDPQFVAQAFAYSNLTDFFTQFKVQFEIAPRPTTQTNGADYSASFFPMFPELTLTVGKEPTSFWTANPVSTDYAQMLNEYFQQLQVEYENNLEQNKQPTGSPLAQLRANATGDDTPSSMAGYLFSAYFAMLTKAAVQNAQDFLQTYSFNVADAAETSLQTIADSFDTAEGQLIARQGDTHETLAAHFDLPVAAMMRANGADETADAGAKPIAPGTRITVPITVKPADIVTANQNTQGVFASASTAGAPLQLSNIIYQVQAKDTFNSVGQAFSFGSNKLMALAVMTSNAANATLLQAGQTIELPVLTYTGKTGDTLDNVALYFNVPATQVTQNGNTYTITGATHTLSGGFVMNYTVKQGDTLDSILQYFFGPLTDKELPAYEALLQQWNIKLDLSQALNIGTQLQIPYNETLSNLARYYFPNTETAKQLTALAPTVANLQLTPLATVTVNGVSYPAQASDSFSSVAQKFNYTLDELTKQIAAQTGLFPNGTALTVPNVPAIKVADLIAGLSTAPATNTAAAQTSRFLLQGLRLPYPTLNNATYPLYNLTAQSFPLNTAEPEITLAFDPDHAAPWITFAGNTPTLTLAFDQQEEAQLAAFETLTLQPQISWLGRLPLFNYQPLHFNVSQPQHWQAAVPPSGACFTNAQAVAEPLIWPLPDTLSARLADADGAALFYELDSSSYVNSTVGVQTSEIKHYAWATAVKFTVQQIAAAPGEEMPNTYLIVGADDTGKQSLFDVLNYLNSAAGKDDAAQLYLLYTPDPQGSNPQGLASGQPNDAKTFLLKTNLSTLSHSGLDATRAPEAATLPEENAENAASQSVYAATLQDSPNFMTLLWEASVVKSGGFYLQYTDSGQAGLPGYLFTQETNATLTLLILLNTQTANSQAALLPFNNAVVVADNIDTSRANVFVAPRTYQVKEGDTLQHIAQQLAAFNLDVPTLAVANQTIQQLLKPGLPLTVNGQSYTIQYGDTFASIAAAAKPPLTVAALATANQTATVFTPGALIQFAAGQLDQQAAVPPGNTGFQLWRNYLNKDANQQQLNLLFNLLGFQINANNFFALSHEGLPAAPVQEPGTTGTEANADDGVLYYRQVLAVSKSALPALSHVPATPALPAPAASPYAGIALDPTTQQLSTVQIELAFHDLSGSRTVTSPAPVLPPLPVGYTDDLLGLAQWPSATAGYDFPNAQPNLQISVAFSPVKYLPGSGQPYQSTHQSALAHCQNYTSIYYQLQEPSLQQVSASTSLGTLPADLATRQQMQLALNGFVSQAYLFLNAAQQLQQVFPDIAQGTQLGALAAKYSVSVGDVLTANKDVELVGQLFGDGTVLNIPTYYNVHAGDTLTAILKNLTPQQLAANAQLALAAGTVLNVPAQSFTADAKQNDSLIQLAQAENTTVPNLALQNTAKPVTSATLDFTFGGVTLPASGNDSLQSLTDAFNAKSVKPAATPDSVAVANQTLAGVFAGQTLQFTAYVIQKGDTLTSLATRFNTDVTTLINDNLTTADVFPAGTSLYKAGADTPYTLQAGDTFALVTVNHGISLSELAARNTTAQLLAISAADELLAIPNLVSLPSSSAALFSSYQVQVEGSNKITETIAVIIAKYTGWDAAGFLTLNQALPGLFATTQLPGTNVTPQLTDTIQTLAQKLGQTPAAFVQAFQTANVLRRGALVMCPSLQTPANATLAGVVQTYNLGEALTLAQANSALQNLLAAGQTLQYTYAPPNGTPSTKQYQTSQFDTFVTVLAQFSQMFNATTLSLAELVNQNTTIKLNTAQTLLPPVLTALLPPLAVTLPDQFAEAVFPLAVEVTLQRDQRLVDPDFSGEAAVFSNTTPLAPNASVAAGDPVSLKQFATNFEQAFDQQLKLGVGAAEAGGGASQPQLQVVNFAPARGGISYKPSGAPQFFALQPLSNRLWSGSAPIPSYTSGSGITGTQTKNFQNVDLDGWLSTLLSAVDLALSPQYAMPAYELGASTQSLLADLLGYKQTIAGGLRDLVDFLLNNQQGDLTSAQEALYQQALTTLSSVYETSVLVQFPFDVKSPFTDANAPRLSGKPLIVPQGANGQVANATLVKHTLQADDSFVSIANQLGLTVVELVTANQQAEAFAPGSTLTVLNNGHSVSVEVHAGDTLASLAAKLFPTNTDALADALKDLAVALWNCDLTKGAGGCGYTLNINSTPPVTLQFSEALPVAAFTTGKLPLKQGDAPVTYLLSVKNPAQRRMAWFNLNLAVNELEYNLQTPPQTFTSGAGSYQESSWLTFINPLTATSLGQVQTPIPLRAQPNFPTLAKQSAEAAHPDSQDIKLAREWNYTFELQSQNAAQDSMELGVFYNRLSDTPPEPPTQRAAAPQNRTALYQALAAFAAVAAPISNDLALLRSNPNDKAVGSALQALHDLVKAVSDAWSTPPMRTAALTAAEDGESHWYTFDTIINEQTSNQYQYLTLASTEEEPSWPLIDEAKPALALTQEALYGYTEPISQALALDFKFTDLNTIQHQNGWSGLTVIRNQNLLGSTAEDQQTNPLFVYQTPLTLFANKITPLLSLDTLAPLTPNPAQGTPLAQLTQALADFFSALFDGAPAGTVFQIRAGCQYSFAVTATGATAEAQLQALQDTNALTTNLPLLLVPVAAFNPASDANPQNPESFVAQLAQATLANAATVGVADKDGMPLVAGLYLFEVSAYSSLGTGSGTVASQPMLDINNRYWAVGLSLT